MEEGKKITVTTTTAKWNIWNKRRVGNEAKRKKQKIFFSVRVAIANINARGNNEQFCGNALDGALKRKS